MKKKYDMNLSQVLQRAAVELFLILLAGYFINSSARKFAVIFKSGEYSLLLMPATIIIVCAAVIVLGVSVFSENWRTAFYVELDNDNVTGYSLTKKKMWSMRFDQINEMRSAGGRNPLLVFFAMIIADSNEKTFLINTAVKDIGPLMESIKEKAVNAEKIDFVYWENNWRVRRI